MRIHARIAEAQLQLRRAVAAMRGQFATLPALGVATRRQRLRATRQQQHLLRIKGDGARARRDLALQQFARQRQSLRQEATMLAAVPGPLQPRVQGGIALAPLFRRAMGARDGWHAGASLHG